MHHRPLPAVRSLAPSPANSQSSSPRVSPLLPPASFTYPEKPTNALSSPDPPAQPHICGLPLKYVSLVTLAVQNAALAIVMHYSRISTPPELAYSPASAVLLNEILKGSISFIMAIWNVFSSPSPADFPRYASPPAPLKKLSLALSSVCADIFSPDCWKLSIPAILYVVQNSLQFVAISNLPVATFQVTYQMKILTTAAFSVALLRKKLSTTKWLSLFFLAIGVGIVQIQSSTSNIRKEAPVGSAHEYNVHVMHPMKGFGAVTAACFTSGLAGVYFEMVLKGSKADLWVRNVQLSLFSLIPALLPILYSSSSPQGLLSDLLKNFGAWAWATVGIQVFGGLVTAVVIKYSDNILKGFATSLSIVLSFLASVVLFDFSISWSFVIGASTVLTATWMYNQPPGKEPISIVLTGTAVSGNNSSANGGGSGKAGGGGVSPIFDDGDVGIPMLGNNTSLKRKKVKASPFASPRIIASALGMGEDKDKLSPTSVLGSTVPSLANGKEGYFGEMLETARYNYAPYGSPWPSRPPSRIPSRAPTPTLEQSEEGNAA
ncbi:hypothetical protein P691DRAFT_665751 [Macrolepiota fuliginosa MF-IS2]|uniref:Nucleotide-sugar transporter n=1 Tax=Macrolepiota fuliginosa MF-IS2 TaxID=1400762 RepID=A0A9P5XFY1_9AGAR|nr:hypothetical protein P691DRAFT_665751 [Macrolepiota fuliginosa MF-IS2]